MPESLDCERPTTAGASAVEYGLLVVAIAAVIALVVFALGLVDAGVLQRHLRSDPEWITSGASADC